MTRVPLFTFTAILVIAAFVQYAIADGGGLPPTKRPAPVVADGGGLPPTKRPSPLDGGGLPPTKRPGPANNTA